MIFNLIFFSMIQSFIDNLNTNNIIAYISGGHCYRKYFKIDEETTDYDIHIFITYKQLNEPETFVQIYKCIKNLYKNFSTQYDLIPLTKYDYANFAYKYIDYNLLNKKTEFYLHSIICDLQIEDIDNTYVDISIQVTTDIEKIKETIEDNYYMSKKYFIKNIYNFYDYLLNAHVKDENKIQKIKNRIKFIELNL